MGGSGTSAAYVHGVNFPVEDAVSNALEQFKNGDVNYIQLSIDAENEVILLSASETCELSEVGSKCMIVV